MPKWKTYFVFILILCLLEYMSYEAFRSYDYIDIIMTAMALIGLYGFCWSKRIVLRNFWKTILFINIVWDIYYMYIIELPRDENIIFGMQISQFLSATISLIPYIPLYIALFMYVYKRNNLWEKIN